MNKPRVLFVGRTRYLLPLSPSLARKFEALSHELSERIRTGAIAIDDPALRAHVRQSLADALTINNPKWLTR